MPQNVSKIINLLESRFGRPEYIIYTLLEKIRKLPFVKEDKLETLIEFSDEVKNFVAILESLNEEDHLGNPLLIQEFLNKLPTSYKLRWVNKCSISEIFGMVR